MKLPPLIAVRFFEATARHRSVREAARELHVTPGAVSQQVRRLEDFLSCALFDRLPRGLALTPAGMDYQAACGEALARIGHATARLAAGARRVVRVSCTPDFAAQWLVPRLQLFLQHAPELDVHVNSTHRTVDLLAEDMHFAVRHGLGPYPGLHAEWLLNDDLVPVCSPRLLESAVPRGRGRAHQPVAAEALAELPLLQQSTRPYGWRQWFDAMGVDAPRALDGPRYELFSMLAQAATLGMGVALIPPLLIEAELASGQLVVACPRALPGERAYYLVQPAQQAPSPALAAFGAWLQTVVGATDPSAAQGF